MICQNTDGQSFVWGVDITREPEVRIMQSGEEKGYSSAWLHHKGRNKHHYEYWIDYGTHGAVLEGMKMPVNYVVEMFLDRIAASKVYRGTAYTDRDPLDYFLGGKGQYLMHEETEALLEKLLIMLAKQGEEKTFFVYPAGSFKKR